MKFTSVAVLSLAASVASAAAMPAGNAVLFDKQTCKDACSKGADAGKPLCALIPAPGNLICLAALEVLSIPIFGGESACMEICERL